MTRFYVYESDSAKSEWFDRAYYSANPSPCDVSGDGFSKRETAEYLVRSREELNTLVRGMPAHSSEWTHAEISQWQTSGVDGVRHQRLRVQLEFHDLGRCLIGNIMMNGALKSVLVLLPAGRRHITDENILLRMAAVVPEHIAEKLTAKVRIDGLNAPGSVAFLIMPRKRMQSEPPGIRHYECLMMRAVLRWSKKRDRAGKIGGGGRAA